MITITGKDARRAEMLPPGWKVGQCVNFYTKPASSDGSTVYYFEIEVEHNGLNYPMKPYTISEKAASMGKNFFIACGFPKDKWDDLMKGDESIQLDPSNMVGKKLKVHVKTNNFEGRLSNEASDFLPLEA